MGKSSPRKGCKLSQETKDKISNANRGKVRTNEQKLKLSKAHMGKEFSVKHKDNISEARVGMIFSDEHKQSISNSNGEFYNTKEGREIQSKRNSKPVLQFDNYKNFVSKYKSATDAEKALGIPGVGRVCNGLRKTAGGYVWKWGEFVE